MTELRQYAAILIETGNSEQQKAIAEFFNEERKKKFHYSGDWFICSPRGGLTRYECQIDGDDYILLHNLLLSGYIARYEIHAIDTGKWSARNEI